MRSTIMDFVKTLTEEDTFAFINDDQPSQFYGELFRVLVIRYQAIIRTLSVAERHPDMDIPKDYEWCETPHAYLGQLSVDVQTCRHELGTTLSVVEDLLRFIKYGAESSCLTERHLKHLKIKMEALQAPLSKCLLCVL